MKEENQMIYLYSARIGWKKKRGGGYINNYKEVEFVSRAEDKDQMNSDPMFIMQIMSQNGLTGSAITAFRVIEILSQKEISESFYYKK